MERVLELCSGLDIGAAVIINKHDINPDMTEQIVSYCTESGVYVLGRIPFDSLMIHSMMALLTLPEFAPTSKIALLMKDMWDQIVDLVSK
jgi:MinD superfamily P-loop ATPase